MDDAIKMPGGGRALTFSEAVLNRPQMYTLGGTFEEAIAFLEGYCSGIAKVRPDCPAFVEEWWRFGDWLGQRLNVPDDVRTFARFREVYGTRGDLVRELLSLYEEFLEQRRTAGLGGLSGSDSPGVE